jgi:hypothetical protein
MSRLLDSLIKLVNSISNKTNYTTMWEYTIHSVVGAGPWTITCIPTSTDCPFGDLVEISTISSVAGIKVKPVVNTNCILSFINADPTRPIIVKLDSNIPDEIEIDANDLIKIGESSDLVELGSGSAIALIPTGHVVCYGDIIDMSGVPLPLVPYTGTPAGTAPPNPISKVTAK